MIESVDLAVVGAGPAGLSAARAAAAHGLRVAVFDEHQRAGGQIFRRGPEEFPGTDTPLHTAYRWAPELLSWADRAQDVSWHFGATVLGVLFAAAPPASDATGRTPDGRVGLDLVVSVGGACRAVRARRLVLATGAYDHPVPVPNWTLPGVMTLAGGQGLAASQGILPGSRILLAGSHPLVIIAAARLVDAGANVVEVLLARGKVRPGEAVGALPAIPGHGRILAQAARAWQRLRRAGVPVTFQHVVTRILGDDAVTGADVAAVDGDWRVRGTVRRVDVDSVLLGFGFTPMTDLPRQLRCEMQWDPVRGGWIVRHDASMRTSVAGVYVAGEPTGIAGAEQARAGGQLAGLAVVADAGVTGIRMRLDRRAARRRWRRAVRFSRVVQRMFQPNLPALLELLDEGTDVCRCELITTARLEDVMRANPFITSLNAMKLYCRAGMGLCQGRNCESTVGGLLARRHGVPRSEVGHYAAQLPVRPVSVGALAGLGEWPRADPTIRPHSERSIVQDHREDGTGVL